MKLADKPVYPIFNEDGASSLVSYNINADDDLQSGLTYKQWLVGMLASNSAVVEFNESATYENNISINTKTVIDQANAIISELEKKQ